MAEAVLAGAAAACIVQFALSRNLSMANSAGQRVRAKILTSQRKDALTPPFFRQPGD
jgi:hypothetical protein